MKLLWREKAYGWWSVTGLVGERATWFIGFSRQPPSPSRPLPTTTDPRTDPDCGASDKTESGTCEYCEGTGRLGDGRHDDSGRWIDCPFCDGGTKATAIRQPCHRCLSFDGKHWDGRECWLCKNYPISPVGANGAEPT